MSALASLARDPELAAALGAAVVRATPVGGGDIHAAFRVELADGRVAFVKARAPAERVAPATDPLPGLFAAEAAGLDWLRAGPLRVPRVLAHAEAWLALE